MDGAGHVVPTRIRRRCLSPVARRAQRCRDRRRTNRGDDRAGPTASACGPDAISNAVQATGVAADSWRCRVSQSTSGPAQVDERSRSRFTLAIRALRAVDDPRAIEAQAEFGPFCACAPLHPLRVRSLLGMQPTRAAGRAVRPPAINTVRPPSATAAQYAADPHSRPMTAPILHRERRSWFRLVGPVLERITRTAGRRLPFPGIRSLCAALRAQGRGLRAADAAALTENLRTVLAVHCADDPSAGRSCGSSIFRVLVAELGQQCLRLRAEAASAVAREIRPHHLGGLACPSGSRTQHRSGGVLHLERVARLVGS